MKGRNVVVALALSLTLVAAQASGAVPMVDHGRVVLVFDAAKASPKTVKSAILYGSSELGWRVVDDQPGKLRIRYDKEGGKHSATVDVLYDATSYEMKYVDSVNLKYEDGKIHNTYNRWTANLIKYIGQAHVRSAQ